MQLPINQIILSDCLSGLKTLPDNSVHCCITSPPYYALRDYGVTGQIGLEKTPEQFIAALVEVFEEVRRVLKPDGTCWVNIGDSYSGSGKGAGDTTTDNWKQGTHKGTRNNGINNHKLKNENCKPKDLIGIPWMLAFALRTAGWYLRQDIIWHKPNPMPESVTDRCTKAHEYIFLLSKSRTYFYDAEAIKEDASYNSHERIARAKQEYKTNPTEKVNGLRSRKLAEAGSGTKNNTSFDEAMRVMPDRRNKRSVWSVVSQAMPDAHFATFPERLIDDCIKAGTSEKGCCSECGKPLERITENVKSGRMQKKADGWATHEGGHGTFHKNGREKGAAGQHVIVKQTTGWEPTCNCEASIVPCIVLDPFMGAGTTALVARKLDRNYIGFELNPAYIKIANNRLRKELGMFL